MSNLCKYCELPVKKGENNHPDLWGCMLSFRTHWPIHRKVVSDRLDKIESVLADFISKFDTFLASQHTTTTTTSTQNVPQTTSTQSTPPTTTTQNKTTKSSPLRVKNGRLEVKKGPVGADFVLNYVKKDWIKGREIRDILTLNGIHTTTTNITTKLNRLFAAKKIERRTTTPDGSKIKYYEFRLRK